jgi:hypothetical protein
MDPRADVDGYGEAKISCPQGLQPREVQPVASHYTDCDNLAPSIRVLKNGIN